MASFDHFNNLDTQDKVHIELLKLITDGYLSGSSEQCKRNYDIFKMNCRKYLTTPRDQNHSSAVEFLDALKRKTDGTWGHLLSPGNYTVLRDITKDVDADIPSLIDEAERKIRSLAGSTLPVKIGVGVKIYGGDPLAIERTRKIAQEIIFSSLVMTMQRDLDLWEYSKLEELTTELIRSWKDVYSKENESYHEKMILELIKTANERYQEGKETFKKFKKHVMSNIKSFLQRSAKYWKNTFDVMDAKLVDITDGCILLYFQFEKVEGLMRFWRFYRSNFFHTVLQFWFNDEECLKLVGAERIEISVEISEDEYQKCHPYVQRDQAHAKFLENVRGKKSKRILVMGEQGVGKSSFINSAITAITGKYEMYAYVGLKGERVSNVTVSLTRYSPEDYCEGMSTDNTETKNALPVFIDVMGFDDGLSDIRIQQTLGETAITEASKDGSSSEKKYGELEETVNSILMKYILMGRIPDRWNLMDFRRVIIGGSLEEWDQLEVLQEKEELKIDAVVVIVPRGCKNLPKKLLMAIKQETQRRDLEVPVFGVMSKMDKKDDDSSQTWRELEVEFRGNLGIDEKYFFPLTNYEFEPLLDEGPDPNPNTDVPILMLLNQIYKTERKETREEPAHTCKSNEGSSDDGRKKMSWSKFFPT